MARIFYKIRVYNLPILLFMDHLRLEVFFNVVGITSDEKINNDIEC